jgi:Peptidase family M23
MTDDATTAALSEFLTAAPDERRLLAPDLVQAVGEARLERILEATWQRVGAFVSVADRGRGPHIVGTRGRVAVWAATGPGGRLSGLNIAATRTRRTPAPLMLPLAWYGWALLFAACVGHLWTAGSVGSWAATALLPVTQLVLTMGFGAPSRWDLPPVVRRAFGVGAAVGALSVVRLGGLPSGGPARPWLIVEAGVPLVLVGLLVRARRHRWEAEVSRPLEFPCDSGTWYVAQGGGHGLNHHTPVPPQRGALDLVEVGPRGTRSRGLAPRDPADYVCYGTPLFAPCAGTVVLAVDRYPDQTPGRPRYGPVFGNEVRIDTGQETVVLCHLRPGSVRVRPGDRVRAGDPLGEVGNSGNSTEPHLHLHAERDGLGLQLRFTGVGDALWRGRRLRQRRPADGPVLTTASSRRLWRIG